MNLFKNCIIAQISEGLGNQLFCYAAARGLALKNNVPLYLDADSQYRVNHFNRKYLLDNYCVQGERVNKAGTLLGNFGHLIWKSKVIKSKQFSIFYFEQGNKLDHDLVSKQLTGATYLFGYWQHEEYFKAFSDEIRKDLKRKTLPSEENLQMAIKMKEVTSVCIHIRSYREINGTIHISKDYFENAISHINNHVENPVFFIFSDDHDWVSKNMEIKGTSIPVKINKDRGDLGAMDDLWLMNQCDHHILSSSSFSWWGAWLAENKDGMVIVQKDSSLVENGTSLKNWVLL
jgi:hypothetical protein